LTSLLCLELWPPGELSVGIGWVTLCVGVGSDWDPGVDMAALGGVKLPGLGSMFGPGEELAGVALFS